MAEFWFLFICNMLVPATMLVFNICSKELIFRKISMHFVVIVQQCDEKVRKHGNLQNTLLGRNLLADRLGLRFSQSLRRSFLILQEKLYLTRHLSYFVWDNVYFCS